jgi:hypothetical protein
MQSAANRMQQEIKLHLTTCGKNKNRHKLFYLVRPFQSLANCKIFFCK